jgi:hypothetical protein
MNNRTVVRRRRHPVTITRTAQAALAAAVLIGALAGCSGTSPAAAAPAAVTVATTTAPAAETTPAPVETTPAVVAPVAPVADANSQVVAGVLYQGTPSAPVRIGTDTPGQAPAVDGTIPDPKADFAAFKAASRALAPTKYTVVIAPAYAADDNAAQGPVVGYRWMVLTTNEYGTYKAGARSAPLPTRDAALADPKVLDGRALDRSEYVIVYY